MIALDYNPHAQLIINGTKVTLGEIYTLSRGAAINNNNEVVGSLLKDEKEIAFKWDSSQEPNELIPLPSLGGNYAIAYDINDAGVIVGTSKSSTSSLHAVKWVNTIIHDLGTLGGAISIARSINNNFTIVGYAETANGNNHAFIYMNDKMIDINILVDLENEWVLVDAYTINEHGQILVRAQKNNSIESDDNKYWVLSPLDFVPGVGPEFPADIPFAEAYVCNVNCGDYANYQPQFQTINDGLDFIDENNTIVVFPGVYRGSISYRSKKVV